MSRIASTPVPGTVAPAAWDRRGAGGVPLVIGHRGASALCPENSTTAFARAAADAADGVELDVLCCASGEVAVFHDDDLSRLGGRPERIDSMTWAVLRQVRLLSGERIPTLAEALEACGPRMLVNVELKAAGVPEATVRELVDRVAAIVDVPAWRERVLISSFNPVALWLWRRRTPHVRVGLLCERDSTLPLRRAWALPLLRPFSVHPERVLVDAARVARWHRRRYRVNVWTVDGADEIARLAACDVDGLITNDPARTRQALAGVAPRTG